MILEVVQPDLGLNIYKEFRRGKGVLQLLCISNCICTTLHFYERANSAHAKADALNSMATEVSILVSNMLQSSFIDRGLVGC